MIGISIPCMGGGGLIKMENEAFFCFLLHLYWMPCTITSLEKNESNKYYLTSMEK